MQREISSSCRTDFFFNDIFVFKLDCIHLTSQHSKQPTRSSSVALNKCFTLYFFLPTCFVPFFQYFLFRAVDCKFSASSIELHRLRPSNLKDDIISRMSWTQPISCFVTLTTQWLLEISSFDQFNNYFCALGQDFSAMLSCSKRTFESVFQSPQGNYGQNFSFYSSPESGTESEHQTNAITKILQHLA